MGDWLDLPGRLVVVSGPSGAGKSTVTGRLLLQPGIRARLSVSATTRPPRGTEQDGRDYHFMTREEFEAALNRGEFLEWAEVHGNLYGTPTGPIKEVLARGECVILVIDVQGGAQVKRRVPNALLVFIDAPSLDVLERRLRDRGTDDESAIRRRLENARHEIAIGVRDYDIVIPNHDLDLAVAQLSRYLSQNGCGGPTPDA